MTQKHHQEEISGPLDTIEAVPLAKDLPRSRRARIQSRKVRENQAQNQLFKVLFLESSTTVTTSIHVQNSSILDSLQSSETYEKQWQLLNSQNSSKRSNTNLQRKKKRRNDNNKLNRLEISRKSYKFFIKSLIFLVSILKNWTFRSRLYQIEFYYHLKNVRQLIYFIDSFRKNYLHRLRNISTNTSLINNRTNSNKID